MMHQNRADIAAALRINMKNALEVLCGTSTIHEHRNLFYR